MGGVKKTYIYIVILQYINTMGASKSEHFSETQNEMAKLAKAIAHPARVAILQHLHKVNTCICNDIVDVIPLAQPTISQHLKELKDAGWIKGTVTGKSICYCLNQKTWEKFQQLLLPFSITDENADPCY